METVTTTPRDNLVVALRDESREWTADWDMSYNEWGGVDFRLARRRHRDDPMQRRLVRVTPVDGEWGAGVNVYVMTRSELVLRSATFRLDGARGAGLAILSASVTAFAGMR